MSKKKCKCNLRKTLTKFVTELVDDAAQRAYGRAQGWTNDYTTMTVDELYCEVITKLEVILRLCDKDFLENDDLPF